MSAGRTAAVSRHRTRGGSDNTRVCVCENTTKTVRARGDIAARLRLSMDDPSMER